MHLDVLAVCGGLDLQGEKSRISDHLMRRLIFMSLIKLLEINVWDWDSAFDLESIAIIMVWSKIKSWRAFVFR